MWYLKPKSVGQSAMDSRWETGVWLGVQDETNEIILGTVRGIVKARTVRRKESAEESWDTEIFNTFAGTPWKMTPEAE